MDYDTALAIAGVVGDVNTLNAAFAARLDKLDGLMVHLHRDHHEGVVARIEALERHIERVYNDMAFQDSRLDKLNKRITRESNMLGRDLTALAERVAQLEQAAKDQARNSNASAIAFNGRLDRQGAALQILREEVAELENNLARKERNMLIERVEELEGAENGQPPDEEIGF